MAALKGHKTVGAPFSNAIEMVKVVYDFDKDAGAQSSLDAITASDDMVIVGCWGKVLTTCAGATATVAFGIDSDPDTLIDETAVASLAAGYLMLPIAAVCPIKLASASVLKSTIATANLTAGKIEFTVLLARM
jgi:hypothetical protein